MKTYELTDLTEVQASILVRIITDEIEQQKEWAKQEFHNGSTFGHRHMFCAETMQKVLDNLLAQGLKPYTKIF